MPKNNVTGKYELHKIQKLKKINNNTGTSKNIK